MPDLEFCAFKGFDHPMQVVDRTELPYEDRLAILQEWQASLGINAAEEDRQDVVRGAIHALETGAVVQHDAPDEAPEHYGYGKSGL